MLNRLLGVFLVALVAGCVSTTVPEGTACSSRLVTIDDTFDGARRGACVVRNEQHFVLQIAPESSGKINDSPWYAFRLSPTSDTKNDSVRITLKYINGHHRYAPKISYDGNTWTTLEASRTVTTSNKRRATLTLPIGQRPMWVAAQELLMPERMTAWTRALADSTDGSVRVLGHSSEGRPIHIFEDHAGRDDVIVMVGRQHPPEITGSYGLRGFVPALYEQSPLANSFREQYGIVLVPLMNPDGVVHGNWRHNMHDTDLNRDWGPFNQPETQLIKDYLDALDASGKNVRLFLDFHSTKRNVFYTQSDENPTRPLNFATRWLDAASTRISDDYPYEQAKRHNSELPTSKNYMYSRYGIPAITYELDDITDFETGSAAAAIFAEEMMKIMLEPDE